MSNAHGMMGIGRRWTKRLRAFPWSFALCAFISVRDCGRVSCKLPGKLHRATGPLQTVNMLYGPSLFVSAAGGCVKRCLIQVCQQFVRSVQSVCEVSCCGVILCCGILAGILIIFITCTSFFKILFYENHDSYLVSSYGRRQGWVVAK